MRAWVRSTSGIDGRELARDPDLHGRLGEATGASQDVGVLETHIGIFRGERRRLGVGGERCRALAVRQQRAGEQKGVGSGARLDFRPAGHGQEEAEAQKRGSESHSGHRTNHSRTGTFPAGLLLISWRAMEVLFDSYN